MTVLPGTLIKLPVWSDEFMCRVYTGRIISIKDNVAKVRLSQKIYFPKSQGNPKVKSIAYYNVNDLKEI